MTSSGWSVGVLVRGSETVEPVTDGEESTERAAIEAASDAAMWVAMERGREVYRITAAGADMILTPGLTDGALSICGGSRTPCSRSRRCSS